MRLDSVGRHSGTHPPCCHRCLRSRWRHPIWWPRLELNQRVSPGFNRTLYLLSYTATEGCADRLFGTVCRLGSDAPCCRLHPRSGQHGEASTLWKGRSDSNPRPAGQGPAVLLFKQLAFLPTLRPFIKLEPETGVAPALLGSKPRVLSVGRLRHGCGRRNRTALTGL